MNKKGFTIVEVVVSALVIGVISAVLYSIFFTAFLNYEIEITKIDLNQRASGVLSVIEEDVIEGTSIQLIDDKHISIQYPEPIAIDPDAGTLVPFFPNNFGNAQIDYIIVNDNTIHRQDASGNNVTLARNVDFDLSNFLVQGKHLTATLVLSMDVYGHNIDFEVQKEVVCRN